MTADDSETADDPETTDDSETADEPETTDDSETADEPETTAGSETMDDPETSEGDATPDSGSDDPLWAELLADARAVAEEYRENGWDAVVLEPTDVSPVDREERIGLDVTVSAAEYDVVSTLIDEGTVTITETDVYYRPLADEGRDRRVAFTVERDESSETAVFVPLTYDISDCRDVFERALREEELLTHVTSDATERWISFSHDDPSLFLEETDVRAWTAE